MSVAVTFIYLSIYLFVRSKGYLFVIWFYKLVSDNERSEKDIHSTTKGSISLWHINLRSTWSLCKEIIPHILMYNVQQLSPVLKITHVNLIIRELFTFFPMNFRKKVLTYLKDDNFRITEITIAFHAPLFKKRCKIVLPTFCRDYSQVIHDIC